MKPGGHSHCRLRIGRSGLTRGAEDAARGIPNTLKFCNLNDGDPPESLLSEGPKVETGGKRAEPRPRATLSAQIPRLHC
jgi:hypothetical protein